jgi:hypothetical protein
LDRRLNLAIQNITQAANSSHPASLFDAAASVHYGGRFNFSKKERRQLTQHLDVLVRKASLRIEAAFPVIKSYVYVEPVGFEIFEDQFEEEEHLHYTADRAHHDAHMDGYFTYMKIPDELPWDTQSPVAVAPPGNNALVAGISVANATPGWIQALENHHRLSELQASSTHRSNIGVEEHGRLF